MLEERVGSVTAQVLTRGSVLYWDEPALLRAKSLTHTRPARRMCSGAKRIVSSGRLEVFVCRTLLMSCAVPNRTLNEMEQTYPVARRYRLVRRFTVAQTYPVARRYRVARNYKATNHPVLEHLRMVL